MQIQALKHQEEGLRSITERSIVIAFLFFIGTGSAVAVEISNMDEAVNVAGRQRMLSYRIVKDYLMVSMENRYKNPKEDLEKSIALFEASQAALKGYKEDKELQALLTEVDKVFEKEKLMVSFSFDKSKGENYLAQANALKTAAHKVVLHLEKLSGKKGAAIINKAGRLRALSQRINLLYLLKTMEIESSLLADEMTKAMAILKESLEFLAKEGPSGELTDKEMKKLKKIQQFYQIMLQSDDFVPTIITKKSDRMVKYANELIALYLKQEK